MVDINYYNLDVIISVGYRVKSKEGIIFRKWANNILKQYMLKGYVIDAKRFAIPSIKNITNILEEARKDFELGKTYSAKEVKEPLSKKYGIDL